MIRKIILLFCIQTGLFASNNQQQFVNKCYKKLMQYSYNENRLKKEIDKIITLSKGFNYDEQSILKYLILEIEDDIAYYKKHLNKKHNPALSKTPKRIAYTLLAIYAAELALYYMVISPKTKEYDNIYASYRYETYGMSKIEDLLITCYIVEAIGIGMTIPLWVRGTEAFKSWMNSDNAAAYREFCFIKACLEEYIKVD